MPSALRVSIASVMCSVASLAILPSPASACSIVITDYSQAAVRRWAKAHVDQATAIVDGEVVRAFIPGKQTALVRVHRLLKGPQAETLEVGERNSCDIALMNVGERMRMLLVGGPDVYFLQVDQSLAEYEDKVLKSDRLNVWPYTAGEAISQ